MLAESRLCRIMPCDNCSRACIRLQAGLTYHPSESLPQSNMGWTKLSTFSFRNIHSVQEDPRMRISLGEGQPLRCLCTARPMFICCFLGDPLQKRTKISWHHGSRPGTSQMSTPILQYLAGKRVQQTPGCTTAGHGIAVQQTCSWCAPCTMLL